MPKDAHEQLTKYLTDAHSIEEQALAQLERAPAIAGEPSFEAALREHFHETENHERRVRRLLDARGAAPSGAKDAVMRAGGLGFVLFAKIQPDTPGKLAAHALSYEALEWASYDLLARTADRLGEPEVATVARAIRDEERTMMRRIEALLDRTAEASLERIGEDDLAGHLRTYLADAHALEAQSMQMLEYGLAMLDDDSPIAAVFEEHLDETRTQQTLIEQRLDATGGKRSLLKDAAMRWGAIEWGTFFLGHPDTSGKLAAFAYALEHLELGGYHQLRHVADRAGDDDTANAVARIIAQERSAAERIAGTFDVAVAEALVEQGVR